MKCFSIREESINPFSSREVSITWNQTLTPIDYITIETRDMPGTIYHKVEFYREEARRVRDALNAYLDGC